MPGTVIVAFMPASEPAASELVGPEPPPPDPLSRDPAPPEPTVSESGPQPTVSESGRPGPAAPEPAAAEPAATIPAEVLAAFGLAQVTPVRLAGGQGTAWLAGSVVLSWPTCTGRTGGTPTSTTR